MQKFQDSVISTSGAALAGATVVVTTSTGAQATLYAGNGVDPISGNVLTTDLAGRYGAFAANGRYNCTISAPGHATYSRDLLLFDPLDDQARYITEWPSLQAAIDSGAHTLLIPDGRYVLTSQILLRSNLTLRGTGAGSVLDFSGAPAGTPFLFAAGSLATGTTTDSACDRYAVTIVSTGNGLSVGDWFRLVSTVDANSAEAGLDQLGERPNVVPLTETHQVESLNGAEIGIRGALRFAYPAGSAVRKITAITDLQLETFAIDAGSVNSRPIHIELGQSTQIDGIEVRRARADVLLRGCFAGSRVRRLRAWADPGWSITGTNVQFLKIVDGCVGVRVEDVDLANGGQMIDVTYSPGNALVAPTLDTTIDGGTVRNASASAITDHPCCAGTRVSNVTMHNVRSAVFIRSRDAVVTNIRATGRKDTQNVANCIGIWAGEDGYWNSLTVSNCHMSGFDFGYAVGGSAGNLTQREVFFSGNSSYQCNVGERWGIISTLDDQGLVCVGSQHVYPVNAGIAMEGQWDRAVIRDFFVRGPCAQAAVRVNTTGNLIAATLIGRVADLGSDVPTIKVIAGTVQDLVTDIMRSGPCGWNDGVTADMIHTIPRVLCVRHDPVTLTGTTDMTDMQIQLGRIPRASMNPGASLKMIVRGVCSGTAGTKTIRWLSSSTSFGPAVVLPAAAAGDFVVEFNALSTGNTTQSVYAHYIADGPYSEIYAPSSRTIDFIGGSTLMKVTAQLESASDSVTIRSVEFSGAFA